MIIIMIELMTMRGYLTFNNVPNEVNEVPDERKYFWKQYVTAIWYKVQNSQKTNRKCVKTPSKLCHCT